MIDIQILKIKDPGNFLVREVPRLVSSPEAIQFNEMLLRMNQVYNEEDSIIMRPSEPHAGMVCIGKDPMERKWHRVKIICISQTTKGPQASCTLLDHGKDHVQIPLNNLRDGSEEFFRLPYQAKQCSLYGIQPLSLMTNPKTFKLEKRSCKEWDASAIVFVRDLLKECRNPKMKIVKEDVKLKHHQVMLHLDDPESVEGHFCVNERLVEQEYAVWMNDSTAMSKHVNRVKLKSHKHQRGSESESETPSPRPIVDQMPQLEEIHSPPRTASSDTDHKISPSSSISGKGRGKIISSLLGKSATVAQSPKAATLTELIMSRKQGSTPVTSDAESPALAKSQLSDLELRLNVNRRRQVERDEQERDRSCVSDTEQLSNLVKSIQGGKKGVTGRLPHSYLKKKDQAGSVTSTGNLQTPSLSSDCDVSSSSSQLKSILKKSPAATPVHRRSLSVQIDEHCQVRETSPANYRTTPASHDFSDVSAETSLNLLMQEPIYSTTPKVSMCELKPEDLRMLVKGVSKPKAIIKVEQSEFAEIARRITCFGKQISVSKLQKYIWPAIRRGRNVVGVGSGRKMLTSGGGGKTLAYLVPLLYLLQLDDIYGDLPTSNGPIALVLCPSWKTAWHVTEECKQLLGRSSSLRVQLIYGGIDEESKEVELINGCEVLVSTPASLMRFLERGIITFCRLRHMMMEGTHLLLDKYNNLLEQVMAQCDVDKVQLGVFSSEWNSNVTEFVRKRIPQPLIVVATTIDAASYGGVKHIPVMCGAEQKLHELWGIVDPSAYSPARSIVICCCEPESAATVFKYLRGQSVYVLDGSDASSFDLRRVNDEWNLNHRPDSQPIIVVTDHSLPELDISNASLVIHYEIPPEAELLSRRLWCMRDMYHDCIYNADAPVEVTPLSYLLITQACRDRAAMLLRMLHRSDTPVPESLITLKQQHQEMREMGGRSQLCSKLKAFGSCRNEMRCGKRHMIFDSLDGNDIVSKTVRVPLQGHIKILVTFVENATCLFGRILEEQGPEGKVISKSADFIRLTMKIALHLGDPSNKIATPLLEVGRIHVWQDIQLAFHRVEIIELSTQIDDRGLPERALVRLVDFGGERMVCTMDLFAIPQYLIDVPHQAVEVIVCRVRPVDQDEEWTAQANLLVAEYVQNKELSGKVVLCLGRTLWLDPLCQICNLPAIHSSTVTDMRSSLLQSGMAVENPEHLHALYAACSGRLELPVSLLPEENTCRAYTSGGMLTTIRHQSLQVTENNLPTQVVVTGIYRPDWFYVRLASDEQKLATLTASIADHVRLLSQPENFSVRENLLVLAQCPDDNRWHRGKVDEVLEGGDCEVFFVDIGITEVVEVEKLFPMPTLFQQDPPCFMAIECALVGLEPREGEWSDEDADFLWDATRVSNDIDGKKLYATVLSESRARAAGSQVYGLQLTDTTREYDINLAYLMVSEHRARLSSHQVQELTQGGTQSHYELCSLCAELLASQDDEEQTRLAAKIEEKATECTLSAEQLVTDDVFSCLCVTLQLSRSHDTVACILQAIYHLLGDVMPSGVTEVLTGVLCLLLDKDVMAGARAHIASCFNRFSHSKSWSEHLLQYGGFRILCKCMKTAESDRLKEVCCEAVHSLSKEVKSKETLVFVTAEALEVICDEVQQSGNATVLRLCMNTLAVLATNHSSLREMRRSGSVKAVCLKLMTWRDTQVLEAAVKLLKALANNNRFNKDVMVECKAYEALDRLTENTDLSQEVRRICSELYERLHRLLPSELKKNSPLKKTSCLATTLNGHMRKAENGSCSPIRNIPLPSQLLSCTNFIRSEKPEVKWIQSRWNVLLTVRVTGAGDPKHPPDVSFTTDTASFRMVREATEYAFELGLYETVVPNKCDYKVHPNQVMLGLRKMTKGLWPRLLKTKAKYGFISRDFERVDLSSDEDSSDEEVPPESPLSLITIPRPLPMTIEAQKSMGYLPVDEADKEFESSEEDSGSDDEEPQQSRQLREDKRLNYFTL